MGNYTIYRLAGPMHQSFKDLLPRIPFKKWFHGQFFRLALPYNLDLADFKSIIFSPLSLTVVFRLIPHLRLLGYPSHWLAEELNAIIENKVISSCRPSRSSPLTIAEVRKDYPVKKLCTTPFRFEMATLARMFAPLLLFVLTSDEIPAEDEIYQYAFHLPNHKKDRQNTDASAYLTLVFWDQSLVLGTGKLALQRDLRALLDPSWGDEVDRDFKGATYEKLREDGLIVWSTMTWDHNRKEASAWMPQTFVDGLVEKKFKCGLYRTDTWTPIASVLTAISVSDAVKKGRKWKNGGETLVLAHR